MTSSFLLPSTNSTMGNGAATEAPCAPMGGAGESPCLQSTRRGEQKGALVGEKGNHGTPPCLGLAHHRQGSPPGRVDADGQGARQGGSP
jgi:hypothetical protein